MEIPKRDSYTAFHILRRGVLVTVLLLVALFIAHGIRSTPTLAVSSDYHPRHLSVHDIESNCDLESVMPASQESCTGHCRNGTSLDVGWLVLTCRKEMYFHNNILSTPEKSLAIETLSKSQTF